MFIKKEFVFILPSNKKKTQYIHTQTHTQIKDQPATERTEGDTE